MYIYIFILINEPYLDLGGGADSAATTLNLNNVSNIEANGMHETSGLFQKFVWEKFDVVG